ncbi:MAG: response regulator [Myxococcales bacterium]|nr:response regulator [Myxococcales bacterium]MCB9731396.1 response regulator [Deltaproteobacteria bacterium]
MAELRERSAQSMRIACIVGALSFFGMAFVDPMLVSPAAVPALVAARSAIIGILLLLLATTLVPGLAVRHARVLLTAAFLVTGGGVIAVTVLTGGAESRYHEALFLTMFGYALLPMTWQPVYAAVVYASLVVLYAGAVVAFDVAGSVGVFVTNVGLLTAAWFIGVVMYLVSLRSRYEEFSHRAELANANSRLKELDRAKNRFFANLSHELRTPLTLTLAPVESLLEDPREDLTIAQREKLLLVRRNALRLLRLVDDLLALSKAEATTLRLKVETIDLVQLGRMLIDEVSELTARKSIEVSFAVEGSVVPTRCDPDLIERVFLNLLGNAAKFTPEGGRISVVVRGLDNGIEVSVRDTGIGIPEDALVRVFDRFYQVDDGATRAVGGTGIGLALAKEIVELHGGRIEASSALGVGTTMRFWLPNELPAAAPIERRRTRKALGTERRSNETGLPEWHEALKAARAYRLHEIDLATEHRATSTRTEQARGRAANVLIVEDNPDMVQFLVALLAADFSTTTAANGREGLLTAVERLPDLIISDVMMPEMDGFELVRRLREDATTSRIPVILLTAKDTAEDRIAGRAGGADAYLAKPFSAGELLAAVDTLLRRQETVRDAARDDRDEALVFMATGVSDALEQAVGDIERDLPELVKSAPAALNTAREGLGGVRRVLEQLRAFALAGASASPTPTSVKDAVAKAVEMVSPKCAGRALDVDLRSRATVLFPAGQLELLVAELVENAVTATEPGGQVRILAWDEASDHAVISIRDEGPGVPAQHAERVFFPFYDGPHTGMGLAVARRLVEHVGGEIYLDQSEVAGATFVIRLPVAPASVAAVSQPITKRRAV